MEALARSVLMAALLGCGPKAAVPALHGVPPGPTWPRAPDTPQVAWVGAIELPGMGLGRPMDVACSQASLVIADAGYNTVVHLDLDSRRYRDLTPRAGLQSPVGVHLGEHGEVVVADSAHGAVYISSDARARLKVLARGEPLLRPTAVLDDTQPGYLVVDAGAHCVHHLTEDGSVTGSSGQRGPPGVGFNYPVDATWTAEGGLLVSDGLNAVVQRLVGDATVPVAGRIGVGGEGLVRPKGIAVDELGRVHVVDAAMQHVQVYDQAGQLLGRYGQPGTGPGELSLPAGLSICEAFVFVADSLNRRVAVFRLLEVSP